MQYGLYAAIWKYTCKLEGTFTSRFCYYLIQLIIRTCGISHRNIIAIIKGQSHYRLKDDQHSTLLQSQSTFKNKRQGLKTSSCKCACIEISESYRLKSLSCYLQLKIRKLVDKKTIRQSCYKVTRLPVLTLPSFGRPHLAGHDARHLVFCLKLHINS